MLKEKKSRRYGIGDLGLRMLPSLYRSMKKEIKKQRPDFILYPVPPWYILWIAPLIKRRSGVPYAIDFIDPWVRTLKNENIKSYLSQVIARISRKLITVKVTLSSPYRKVF